MPVEAELVRCVYRTEDRTINPDLQRFMAKCMGAKMIEVKAKPPFPHIAA
jgi:hypothetical protein